MRTLGYHVSPEERARQPPRPRGVIEMSNIGPLQHPDLLAVDALLDERKLDEAQRRLAALGQQQGLDHGLTYLTTRLLYLRGRLDVRGVADRLREVLRATRYFPQAQYMLDAAETGVLTRTAPPARPASLRPPPGAVPAAAPLGASPGPSVPPPARDADAAPGRAAPAPYTSAAVTPRDSASLDAAVGQATLGLYSAPEALSPEPSRIATAELSPPGAGVAAIAHPSAAEGRPRRGPRVRWGEPAGGGPPSDTALPPTEPPGDPLDLAESARFAIGESEPRTAPSLHISTEPGVGGGPEEPAVATDSVIERVRGYVAPAIPRAPGLPRIIGPRDGTPSYAPRRAPSGNHRAATSGAESSTARAATDEYATRYSQAPQREEFVFSRAPADPATRGVQAAPAPQARRPLSRPPGSIHANDGPDPSAHAAPRIIEAEEPKNRELPPAPHRVRSEIPPLGDAANPVRPSLFEVATLLDAAEYDVALSLLAQGNSTHEPESELLRARALAGAGRGTEAHAALTQLARTTELDADIRAGVARLLIELGDAGAALAEARRAAAVDAERPLVRLTLAWAAIRAARATADVRLVSEADRALDGLKTRGGPHPGLVQALRASVQADLGDAERAIGLAQRALGLDPRSPDALAAVATASARLQRVHDAQQAWLRLLECAPAEAEALRASLEAAHIALPSPGTSTARGFVDGDDARSVWQEAELAIIDGNRRFAQQTFEHACRRRLARVVDSGGDEGFPAIGAIAIHALTEDPIWAHFAPFDLSLYSLHRVRAGLDLVYDPASRLDDDMDDFPVTLLLGAYLGQVLCLTYGGRWEGSIAELGTACVAIPERRFTPFAAIAARLRAGRPLEFGAAGDLKLAHPGADAWSEHVSPSVVPPSPWSPSVWPRASLLTRFGRALGRSVVSEWCRRHAAGPLDGSMASLASVEAYLGLIAPTAARPAVDEAWIPRVTVLVGAYVGEVLRETIGGAWDPDTADVRDPAEYRLRLGGRVVTPVLEVHQHLLGRSALPLHEYASRLAR